MLDKIYVPANLEEKWYRHWEQSGSFSPANRPGAPTFSIVIPPPNVTGSLHVGHALNNTLQDILVRYHRLRGYDVLWQPGTDHAGIATQMVVERQLDAQGLNRRDMGRDAFLEKIWAWKAESGGVITSQLRRLGASCDWSRERFTMDEGCCAAVNHVFVELHKRGLLYRAKRLVNWDPKLKTAVSDLEVEPREVQGQFVHFRYPLADGSGHISVATTRPETMLGDAAVAVHPDDARYQALIGRQIAHPLTGRLIPIVADEWANPELGSGAVKITPAHDFNDFAVGERHTLPKINIFDADARLNDAVPVAYQGLDRFEARKQIIADMDALGLLEKVESKIIQMPYGDRSGVVIEPWLTDQWYVDAPKLAEAALEVVESGQIKFVPENWVNTYYEWMRNIQPWCVSRQLWWGHQIPAWYDEKGAVFVAETLEDAQKQAGPSAILTRDEDVLDTWFSSALWPFATLGWPEETPEMARFYPTSVLVTGFDIIFFWVARMIMQGLEFTGKIPFPVVYCHGLVRDEKGQKMSKSKGNVVDPLSLIDRYGADALRFTLAAMETQGRDIKLSEKRIEGYRNFGTKLWNAARFCEMNGIGSSEGDAPPSATLAVNRWIIAEVASAAAAMEKALAAYRFDEFAAAIYQFAWNQFCDWYVELIKPILMGEDGPALTETRSVAAWAFDQILVMLHPLMPFITEELWHARATTPRTTDLINAAWPQVPAEAVDATAQAEIGWLVGLITAIRSARSEVNVPPSAKLAAYVQGDMARVQAHAPMLQRLARLESLMPYAPGGAGEAESLQLVYGDRVIRLPIGHVVDLAAERARLSKTLDKCEKEAEALQGRLANAGFVAKAPPEVIVEHREKSAALLVEARRLRDALAMLG